MSLISTDGELNTVDDMLQRINHGTIGGEHVIPRGIGGKKVLSIADDSDPTIIYGLASGYSSPFASFTFFATDDFVFGGTQNIIGGFPDPGVPGSAAQYRWKGSQIAVLASTNPYSGTMRVFIDGIETAGRVGLYTAFRFGQSFATATNPNPILNTTATTVPALAGALNFPAAGRLYINGELIDYTSRDVNGFYGCTRGVGGTTAANHNTNETIYLWSSTIGLYQTGWANKQVVYYNPLLGPGEHKITIVAETNASSGNAKIFFDGFVTGSLLGSSNIFSQIATLTITGSTDANGHADIGGIVSANNDIAKLSFLGMTQTNCETSNTNVMAKLGVRYQTDGSPYYYLHNGPVSTTITVTITFAYIGETL